MATKKRSTTIKRGTCRVIKGKTRICATKTGQLYLSVAGGVKKRKSTTKKRKSTAQGGKLKKPIWCKTAPKKSKGICYCTTKTGKKKRLRKNYCSR